jgi:hypothetical protein
LIAIEELDRAFAVAFVAIGMENRSTTSSITR